MLAIEEIPEAVASMRNVFKTEKTCSASWRKGQLKALLRLLREGKDELCEAMKKDLHKSMFEGYMTEINMVENECYNALYHLDDWMAPQSKSTNLYNVPSTASSVYNDPMGVVLIMGAWNYNVVLTLEPLVGALAGGNCVLLKPGNYSTNSSEVMARLVAKYLDNDCVKVITGNRVVNAACLKEKWDLIFFTGSPFVGKLVARAAAEHLTPIVLELGGKSPCVVDKTCDLAVSVKRMVFGAMLNCGQTCVRPDYFLVDEEIGDQFVRQVQATLREFYGSDAQKTEWFGRVVNDSSFRRLVGLMESSKEYIVAGGKTEESERYIEPTVFDFGSDFEAFSSSAIMGEEVFGPLFPVVRYSNLDQAIDFIRAGEKPLALYCFTSDSSVRGAILNRTYSGGAVINDCCVHLSNGDLPFGGVGNSGMGNYHGKYSYDTFTHQKAVMQRNFLFPQMENALRYPPYGEWNQKALQTLQMPIWALIWDRLMHQLTPKNGIILALILYIFRLRSTKAAKL